MNISKAFKRSLVVLALLAIPVVAWAQAPAQVLINYPDITTNPNALSLGLYFTLLDSDQQVVSDAKIDSATVQLGDGSTYDASVEQPTSKVYIVLVLDASGSMAGAMPTMRDAAAQAVKNAPDQSVFAVIQFNDKITLIQDFSEDRQQVADKIGTIRAVPNAGTCLYDAVYRGIELLDAAPRGRRGVILFTDGNDVTAQGTPCSQHVLDDVTALATQQDSRVPIHTIGLSSGGANSINEDELRNMASATGGFSEIGDQNSLSLLFQKIIDGLANQWYARADIYPKSGTNTATLTIKLADGTQLTSGQVTFESPQDFVAPPKADVKSISYNPNGNVVFNLALTNADQIAGFQLQVTDVQNNAPAPPFTADATNKLEVAASNFVSGSEYILSITGQDASGNALFQTEYKFRYNPTIVAGALTIASVQQNPDNPEFNIEVRSQNIEGIAKYEYWLIDSATNTVVPGSRHTAKPTPDITLPLDGIANGTYTIELTAVDENGQVLAQTTYEQAVYRVGLFKRLRRSPVVLIVLGVVVVAGAGLLTKFLVFDRNKEELSRVLLENTMSRQAIDLERLDNVKLSSGRLDRRRQREQEGGGGKPSAPAHRPHPEQRRGPAPAAPSPAARPEATPPAAPRSQPAAAPAHRQPQLVVVSTKEDRYAGGTFVITGPIFTIGRQGNDLDLDLPSISRRHAVIQYRDGQYTIRDEGSTNGTALNGEIITRGGEFVLESGAIIDLGKGMRLRFEV